MKLLLLLSATALYAERIEILRDEFGVAHIFAQTAAGDHKDSPHYDDQAEKLFSKPQAKPTFFDNRKELEKHVTGRTVLDYQ